MTSLETRDLTIRFGGHVAVDRVTCAFRPGAASAGLPILPQLFHPDRWLLWLGVLFVVSIYFFPSGIAGRLRHGRKPA